MTDTHDILRTVVRKVRCKPGWYFRLGESEGALRLFITVQYFDSSKPDLMEPKTVSHLFPVPAATYNEATWRRWIFEQCRGVENHELGEWFRLGDERPFMPLHGPGENPYVVHEFRPMVDGLTTQDGTVREPYVGDHDHS